jgi:hypothetical protein
MQNSKDYTYVFVFAKVSGTHFNIVCHLPTPDNGVIKQRSKT